MLGQGAVRPPIEIFRKEFDGQLGFLRQGAVDALVIRCTRRQIVLSTQSYLLEVFGCPLEVLHLVEIPGEAKEGRTIKRAVRVAVGYAAVGYDGLFYVAELTIRLREQEMGTLAICPFEAINPTLRFLYGTTIIAKLIVHFRYGKA